MKPGVRFIRLGCQSLQFFATCTLPFNKYVTIQIGEDTAPLFQFKTVRQLSAGFLYSFNEAFLALGRYFI
jgi:hypothetical protein